MSAGAFVVIVWTQRWYRNIVRLGGDICLLALCSNYMHLHSVVCNMPSDRLVLPLWDCVCAAAIVDLSVEAGNKRRKDTFPHRENKIALRFVHVISYHIILTLFAIRWSCILHGGALNAISWSLVCFNNTLLSAAAPKRSAWTQPATFHRVNRLPPPHLVTLITYIYIYIHYNNP